MTPSAVAAAQFGLPNPYPVDGSPLNVVVTDLDHKNGLDLVTANEAGEDGPSLSILFNQGTGAFAAEVRKSVDVFPLVLHAIAAGDFNGDAAGDVALAVDDLQPFPPQAKVLVYRNDGLGGLAFVDQYLIPGFFPQSVTAVDVTGDRVVDLIVCHTTTDTSGTAQGLISVLRGNSSNGVADGSFTVMPPFRVGSAPTRVAVADVDADGKRDLVVADPDAQAVFILYGNGGPSLFNSPVTLSPVIGASAVVVPPTHVGPLPDVWVTNSTSGQLLIFHQTASRTFIIERAIPFARPLLDLAVADFDRDGMPDALVLSGAQFTILYGRSNGTFTSGESVALTEAATRLTVADLNGDTLPDAATTSSVANPAAPDVVSVTLNAQPPPDLPGDANCDHRVDSTDVAAAVTRLFEPGCPTADANTDGRVTVADVLLIIDEVTTE